VLQKKPSSDQPNNNAKRYIVNSRGEIRDKNDAAQRREHKKNVAGYFRRVGSSYKKVSTEPRRKGCCGGR
jgi:hypothetical protein